MNNTMKSDLFKQQTRQFPEAIDSTFVFDSRPEAENYAKTCPTAYSGQILAYLAGDEQKPAIVQPDKSLKDIEGVGPKGDKGDTGTTGATGAKGDKGDKGDAGVADIQSGDFTLTAGGDTTISVQSATFLFYRIAKMMYINGIVNCSTINGKIAFLMGLPRAKQNARRFPLSVRASYTNFRSDDFEVNAFEDYIEITMPENSMGGAFQISGWYELR